MDGQNNVMALIVHAALNSNMNIPKETLRANLTADRIDNDEEHNLSSIQPLCVLCNTSKSNK